MGAAYCYRTSFELAQQLDRKSFQVAALTCYGDACHAMQLLSNALEAYSNALLLTRQIGCTVNENQLFYKLGSLLTSKGEFKRATQYMEQSLSRCLSTLSKQEEALRLSELSSTYFSLGDKIKALALNQQAQTIFQQLVETTTDKQQCQHYHHCFVTSLNNMGFILNNIGKTDKAQDRLSCATQVVNVQTKKSRPFPGSHTALGIYLHNSAVVHRSEGNFQKAIEFTEQSIAIAKQLKDSKQIAVRLNALGVCYFSADRDVAVDWKTSGATANETKALELYDEALQIAKQLNDTKLELCINHNIACLYLKQKMFQK
jgi:tetratricopeptide (TPR) repeat protein